MSVEEQRQVLRSLETHYQDFLRDSRDATSFPPEDRQLVEQQYSACTNKYQLFLRGLEKGTGTPRNPPCPLQGPLTPCTPNPHTYRVGALTGHP